jgi:hypothetical protein
MWHLQGVEGYDGGRTENRRGSCAGEGRGGYAARGKMMS